MRFQVVTSPSLKGNHRDYRFYCFFLLAVTTSNLKGNHMRQACLCLLQKVVTEPNSKGNHRYIGGIVKNLLEQ